MDVLNIISWLKSKKQVTTVDPTQTLIPLGLKNSKRDDGYLPGAITVADFIALSPGLPSFIEYNETNNTLWNSGNGSVLSNTSFGQDALSSVTNGFTNTAYGWKTLQALTTGDHNTAIGSQSLSRNNNGNYNTAVGSLALNYLTTGVENTAIGYGAGWYTTTGSYNIALGLEALTTNSIGSSNTAIGVQTSSGNFSNSIILGRAATATASNQFVVGSAGFNAGAIATETITPNRTWTVRINGANYKIPMVAI
jgi:hypothetical protein